VRRTVLRERTVAESLAWTAVAVLVPAVLRYAVDQGQGGIPFLTFFPAVLLVAIMLGWQYGALTALFSGIIANRMFREDPVLFYVGGDDLALVTLFAITCAIVIDAGALLRRMLREQEAARRLVAQVNDELLHRIKNMLTVVQSLAQLSARHSEPGAFGDAFAGRLGALCTANELLRIGHENNCNVAELATAVIAPFRDDENFALGGPEWKLPRETCVPLALGLHELCTNAAKYGALSVPEGRVSLTWSTDGAALTMRWKESGGPKVVLPSRSGMGSRLLRPQPGLRDLQLRFEPDGVECEIVIAAEANV
jgi:two-component sensor histidine kinase